MVCSYHVALCSRQIFRTNSPKLVLDQDQFRLTAAPTYLTKGVMQFTDFRGARMYGVVSGYAETRFVIELTKPKDRQMNDQDDVGRNKP
jgi:hypothetical protein